MSMPQGITRLRAVLYMYMVSNTNTIDVKEFMAGCQRFALDNPVPTITARLAWYGNDGNSLQ